MCSKELFFTAWLIYSFSSEITVPKWRTGLKMLQTMSVINFVPMVFIMNQMVYW